MAVFFFWLALLVLASFWDDFFCFDFGELSPITFNVVALLTRRRHGIFSASRLIVLTGLMVVNGEAELFVLTAYPPG